MKAFNEEIHQWLGPAMQPGDLANNNIETLMLEPYKDNVNGLKAIVPNADNMDPANAPTAHSLDQYLNAEVGLPKGGEMITRRVRNRVTGPNRAPLGHANQNPMLDTRWYEVEFLDGSVSEYGANLIAENMWA